ncbi:MAG TPA: hypothetical protein EYP34_01360, partial [Chromatiaceae bacterium]|nr:hypothetical protein [Chromatiaceae bacterium]
EKEPITQAYNVSERTLCLRLLCSAKNPDEAWDMYCDLCESMTRFIADLDHGRYLPRERQENQPGDISAHDD